MTEPNEKSAGQLLYEIAAKNMICPPPRPWDKLSLKIQKRWEGEAKALRPGHDVTDGATGKPYSQAGEKSAGQLAYEKDRASAGWLGSTVAWDDLSQPVQRKWQFNATVTPKAQTIKAP